MLVIFFRKQFQQIVINIYLQCNMKVKQILIKTDVLYVIEKKQFY